MVYTAEDKQKFVAIFKSNATDVSRACKAMGIGRKTFYNWYNDKDDSTFRDAIDDAREEIKDFAESQLLTLMKGIPKLDADGRIVGWVSRPDTACIIFFNKTKNKDRGYDERSILKREGDWPADITIQVTTPEQAQQLKEFLNAPPDATKTE
jgi:AcrR family transcriptional regulator